MAARTSPAARTRRDGSAPDTLTRGIEFRNVSFTYPSGTTQVLSDVDLLLPAGSIIGLVGENGSGKSTLLELLAGLYQPSAGSIAVDGTDLATIDPVAWRARVSAAFQDFPRWLATQLGKSYADGHELSGGQWQTVALARAMMRETSLLLILDEPTASLDAHAEYALFERYAQQARRVAHRNGGLCVLVSHRFSTVRMADVIVVIDGGRVTELGSHDLLMERDGTYAALYRLQAVGYR